MLDKIYETRNENNEQCVEGISKEEIYLKRAISLLALRPEFNSRDSNLMKNPLSAYIKHALILRPRG